MKSIIPFVCLVCVLILVSGLSYSQEIKHCSTPEMNRQALEQNPDAAKAKQKLDQHTLEYSNRAIKEDETYIIPVVFHIVHDNGDENISKEQILDAIQIMNNDYRKMNTDTAYIISQFTGIAADCNIEFRLAQKDPNGGCTDGIIRVESETTYLGSSETKYASPAWPREMYLNIWIVAALESGAAGYSYYPSMVDGYWGQDIDGILLLHDYVGSIGTGSTTRSRTLTHEAGHYLNLAHPWGSSNDPGLASNCDMDDDVNDTPLTIGSDNCNLYQSSCGSLDNVQNYMEYSYCSRMFTEGQKVRMRAALNSSISSRNNLWSPNNLIATGTNEGYSSLCVPIAEFSQDYSRGCQGFNVQFNDLTYNTIADSCDFFWVFEGGQPATSTDREPAVHFQDGGYYDVSLTVSNSTGTDQITKVDQIHSIDTITGGMTPFIEGFEDISYPVHPSVAELSWIVENDGVSNWQRTTVASSTDEASLRIYNRSNEEGIKNTLYSPNINISNADSILYLTFNVAYAKYDVYSKDILQIKVSKDCGNTWSIKYFKQGSSSLITNGGGLVTNYFIPDEDEWRKDSVDLSSYIGDNFFMLLIECTSKGGNYLYIDDIQIHSDNDSIIITDTSTISDTSSVLDIISDQNISVLPNPFVNDATINCNIDIICDINIIVSDVTGRLIGNIKSEHRGGNSTFKLSEIVPNIRQGVYFINMQVGNQLITKKVICIK